MKHDQAQKLFQQWSDGGGPPAGPRPRIQAHLDECRECRNYYEKMSLLLEKPDRSSLPRLEPDPFLPARIKTIAHAGAGARRPAAGRRFSVLRASFAAMIFAIAIAGGVFLGNGLSTLSSTDEEIDLTQAYYTTFSQTGFADDLQVIIEENQDEM
jgi:predicted anti-sigma-YlaC factor YlaD